MRPGRSDGSFRSLLQMSAQYFALPRIDHVDLPAGEASDGLIRFAVVFGPVVSKPTLDPNTDVRAKKDDCRHTLRIPAFRRLHLT